MDPQNGYNVRMFRMLALTVIVAAAFAQGSGGRDAGGGPNAVLFARWKRSSEKWHLCFHSSLGPAGLTA